MQRRCPCEIVIWYVLPKLRAEIARKLVSFGLSQQQAADELGITQVAVSQYLGNKRGSSTELKDNFEQEINDLAQKIFNQESKGSSICELCYKVRESKVICKLHREHEQVPADCTRCFEESECGHSTASSISKEKIAS